jgi:hypothetical protein
MTILRICGLLSLLALAAFSEVPAATSDATDSASRLSEYVYLHETRSQSVPLQIAGHANMCPGPRN